MNKSNANLSYGLNARHHKNKRKKGLIGFDGSDDSHSDDDGDARNASRDAGPASARSAVNRDIAAEQAAVRKRAQAQAARAASATYDYDAEYDSFSSAKQREDAAAAAARTRKDAPKAPRYISKLLQTAQRRNQAQEIIYERQVLKEQAKEDASLQYEGKEKFVTSSYKRKLAERERWTQEEEERTRREEADDVTKKKKGLGSFMFGGVGRSLLLGSERGAGARTGAAAAGDDGGARGDAQGGEEARRRAGDGGEEARPRASDGGAGDDAREESRESSKEAGGRRGSRESGRDANGPPSRRPPPSSRLPGDENEATKKDASKRAEEESGDAPAKPKTRQQLLEERAAKIRAVRERYFQRRGAVTT